MQPRYVYYIAWGNYSTKIIRTLSLISIDFPVCLPKVHLHEDFRQTKQRSVFLIDSIRIVAVLLQMTTS